MTQSFMDAVAAMGGIEEAARQLDEARRAIAAATPEERWGVRVVERADPGEAVPPEEIPGLLASAPARGLFALERATFDPAVPAAAVRTILSAAFGDARVASETKAELLWRYNHEPDFRDAALADLRGPVPFCLLDSEEGRRSTARASSPATRPSGARARASSGASGATPPPPSTSSRSKTSCGRRSRPTNPRG